MKLYDLTRLVVKQISNSFDSFETFFEFSIAYLIAILSHFVIFSGLTVKLTECYLDEMRFDIRC